MTEMKWLKQESAHFQKFIPHLQWKHMRLNEEADKIKQTTSMMGLGADNTRFKATEKAFDRLCYYPRFLKVQKQWDAYRMHLYSITINNQSNHGKKKYSSSRLGMRLSSSAFSVISHSEYSVNATAAAGRKLHAQYVAPPKWRLVIMSL